MSSSIVGLGLNVPERRLTNFDLESMVDTSDEWITQRTGIKERRIVLDHQASSDLAEEASKEALAQAGVPAEELDLIVVATITPDMLFPSTACFLQSKLGAMNAAAFDVSAACSGFVYGLAVADSFISTGRARNALVCGSEVLSKFTDYSDRRSCVLFGDGAGAAVLSPSTRRREIVYTFLGADGRGASAMMLPAGGSRNPASPATVASRLHYMQINGREVFELVVKKMGELIADAMEKCKLQPSDVKLIVPHQVNYRIIASACRMTNIDLERVYLNIDRYGNTSSASIPIALCEAERAGKLSEGDVVILVAFGAGLTWGSAVIRW